MTNDLSKQKVVYLFGAGASHACVDYWRSPYGILMSHLKPPMANAVRALVTSEGREHYRALYDLTNDLVDDHTDYEHLITFLEDSPSALHRRFADELRRQFEIVLRTRLDNNETELGADRFVLYAILLDMYNIMGCPEELRGALTINYDDYLEAAVAAVEQSIDFGVAVSRGSSASEKSVKVIKLHGSFQWTDTWPIVPQFDRNGEQPLWIPPGIHKRKEPIHLTSCGVSHENFSDVTYFELWVAT